MLVSVIVYLREETAAKAAKYRINRIRSSFGNVSQMCNTTKSKKKLGIGSKYLVF